MEQLFVILIWACLIAYILKTKTSTIQMHLLAAWTIIGSTVLYALGRLIAAALA